MSGNMWSRAFWKATTERAVKTFAQTEAALLLAAGTGLLEAPWWASLSASGMAGAVSVLTSIGSAAATDGSPSLTDAETLTVVGRHAED